MRKSIYVLRTSQGPQRIDSPVFAVKSLQFDAIHICISFFAIDSYTMDSLLYEYNEMMQNLMMILIIKKIHNYIQPHYRKLSRSRPCRETEAEFQAQIQRHNPRACLDQSTLFKGQGVSGGACTASIGVIEGAFFPLRRGILSLCSVTKEHRANTMTTRGRDGPILRFIRHQVSRPTQQATFYR